MQMPLPRLRCCIDCCCALAICVCRIPFLSFVFLLLLSHSIGVLAIVALIVVASQLGTTASCLTKVLADRFIRWIWTSPSGAITRPSDFTPMTVSSSQLLLIVMMMMLLQVRLTTNLPSLLHPLKKICGRLATVTSEGENWLVESNCLLHYWFCDDLMPMVFKYMQLASLLSYITVMSLYCCICLLIKAMLIVSSHYLAWPARRRFPMPMVTCNEFLNKFVWLHKHAIE